MGGMLTICNERLPDDALVYAAFRLAACDTLERMVLNEQVFESRAEVFGFLTEVPFLKNVPPQVQLDQLAATWSRHLAEELLPATLVDESVIYAVCETASRLIQSDPVSSHRILKAGPRGFDRPVDPHLAQQIQALHLDLANEGDFLLISQFQDIPPDEARPLKRKFQLDESACEAMFELLSRWYVSPAFAGRAGGLLDPAEITRAIELFRCLRSAELHR
jgi:hypothetical protein